MNDGDETDTEPAYEVAELRRQIEELKRAATKQKGSEEVLERQIAELSFLNRLSREVNRKLAPKQVATAALDGIVQVLHPDLALFFVRKNDQLQLYDVYSPNLAISYEQMPSHRVGDCLCGRVASTGASVYSNNVYDDVRGPWQLCNEIGMRSFVALPLRAHDQVIGVLGLGSHAEYAFEGRREFLDALADCIATALENAQQYDQTRKWANYLIALNEATQEEFDLDSVLQTIVTNLVENASSAFARIWLVDKSDTMLVLKASAGLYSKLDGRRSAVRIADDPYKLGQIARSQRPFTTNDVQESNQFDQRWAKEQGIVAFAGYPLMLDDRLIGVLVAFSKEPFSNDVLDMLADFSNHAAIVVKNAQLYAAEKEQRTLAESLRDTAAVLSSTLNLDQVLDRILTNLENVSSHSMANVMLIEDGIARVVRHRGYLEVGLEGEALEALRFAIEDTPILRRMCETGQPLYVSDTHDFPGWKDVPEMRWLRSSVGAPIRFQRRTLGFLHLDSDSLDAFSPTLTKYLLMFADQAGVAIQNAHLFRVSWDLATRLAALNAISAAAMSSLELEAVLHEILELVCQTLNADRGYVLLGEPASADSLITAYPTGHVCAMEEDQPTLCGTIPNWVISHNQPVCIADVGRDARFASDTDGLDKTEIGSVLCVPLKSREQAVGAIELIRRSGEFSDDDLHWLESATTISAMALENIRLYMNIRSRADELVMLNQLGLALSSTLDLRALIDKTLFHVRGLVQAETITIFLPDPQTHGLRCVYQQMGSEPVDVTLPIQPRTAGLIGVVAESAQPVLVDDVASDPRWDARLNKCLGIQPRAMIAVPLEASDQVIGALGAFSTKPAHYTSEDLRRLQIAASTLAATLDKARLYSDLKILLHEREQTQAQLVQSAKMSALGRLVASIAHEINNPIQAIHGYLTLAQEEVAGDLSRDALERYLAVAASEIKRIAMIVERMRDFYRPARDEIQTVDVHTLLSDVLALTSKHLQKSNVTVDREWNHHLPVIRANPDHLKQVFLNLIINAIDAMPDGGTLVIFTAPDRFRPYEVSSRQTGPLTPAVRIEFTSGGEIIPPEILPRVFEPFFTTKVRGSGLGLYVSYGIIEAHHGQISVTSDVDQGTTFTILLPVGQL